MFFESWTSIGRVVLTAALAYAALVVMVRVSGKRTLSKLNAFDLVVTVALGSTLSSVILDRSVPLLDGLVALAALILLQYAAAWSATRSARVNGVLKSEPRVLFHAGAFAREAMREERVTEDAILAAVRTASAAGLDEVDAVVLESSGDLSVLRRVRGEQPRASTLQRVSFDGAPHGGRRSPGHPDPG